MSAEDLLKEGKLSECLSCLSTLVQSDPSNSKLRVFLFQLFCILGEWQRAGKQLAILKDMDASTIPMVQTYQTAIRCEQLRHYVFSGERLPVVFGEPEQWIADLIEANRLLAQGHIQNAAKLRNKAFESAEGKAGKINGEPFNWIADADSRLGPVIEAIINGRYYWVPYNYIASISLDIPTDLRDYIWLPAQFKWNNGGDAIGLIPTRYPHSHEHERDQIKLGRETLWSDRGSNYYQGFGQRILSTDINEYAILDVRTLEFSEDANGGTDT